MTNIEWVGQIDYAEALERQRALAAELTARPDAPDRLLLLEHPPTFTLGRRGDIRHLLVDEATLARRGFAFHRVERGGDITYHGPGQLVGYPILNLKRLYSANTLDLHRYVSDIEGVIIAALSAFGVAGWRYPGYTGVWVSAADGAPAKIAAIGVRVSSKGISSHGFALNVNPNLSHFDLIVPCGIREHGVTSLAKFISQPVTIENILPVIIGAFHRIFPQSTTIFSSNHGDTEITEQT